MSVSISKYKIINLKFKNKKMTMIPIITIAVIFGIVFLIRKSQNQSAITDLEKLKSLVGETNSLFFNQKGELILPKVLIEQIKDWDGRLNMLTCSSLIDYTVSSPKPLITQTQYIDFNN